jgi:NADP-dependent 3-hydroxy acid dehydrogenase YdfG
MRPRPGASSDIGRDLALAFAKMGAKVALMARRKALLETLADEIAAAGGEALPLAADVRDAADRTLARFNRIDVLMLFHVSLTEKTVGSCLPAHARSRGR